MLDDHLAVDLLLGSRLTPRRRAVRPDTCWGAYVLERDRDRIEPITAKVTVLATGGCGKVYLYTTNPDVATGDGMAMAYRAGAGSPISSSCSSIRPASTIPAPSRSC